MRGSFSMRPRSRIIRRPLPSAETFPRLPPGMTITSGTCQSNCCTTSMPTVFCPSMRSEFIELPR